MLIRWSPNERGYAANHARLVAIEQKKHVALRDGLQCETVDANYSHAWRPNSAPATRSLALR